MEDNLLNNDKVEHIREGIRGKVRNILFINQVRSFNVLGKNYDEAPNYFNKLIQEA